MGLGAAHGWHRRLVYARGERTCMNEIGGAHAFSREIDALLGMPVTNVLAVPVVIENHVCGSLILVNRMGEARVHRRATSASWSCSETRCPSRSRTSSTSGARARSPAATRSRPSTTTATFTESFSTKSTGSSRGQRGELALLFHSTATHLKGSTTPTDISRVVRCSARVSFILQRTLADTVSRLLRRATSSR